ncbi:hypothetical protein [Bradyrhizobium sp. 166]|uniref:hypothetical protein n=1 Tax=Bradyrhizobium sp. 166 TaxID=2782638 RepID=UPI001FF80E60|nr:hypothetical protein [Bradyrhizobium sp. 166]
MDDILYGARDKRGNWTPNKRPERAPIFVWPVQPKKVIRWLPGYFLPWNTLYFVISLVSWIYLTPALDTMREFRADWILLILLRNAGLTLLVYGSFHFILYIQRRQETNFKYNAKWPDTDNTAFMFGSQTAENVFWTMCSAVPVWTAYEAATWWLYANSYLPYVDFGQHPVYCAILVLVMPVWRELHTSI